MAGQGRCRAVPRVAGRGSGLRGESSKSIRRANSANKPSTNVPKVRHKSDARRKAETGGAGRRPGGGGGGWGAESFPGPLWCRCRPTEWQSPASSIPAQRTRENIRSARAAARQGLAKAPGAPRTDTLTHTPSAQPGRLASDFFK